MVADSPKQQPPKGAEGEQRGGRKGKIRHCRIIFLDNTDMEMQIEKESRGKELFEKICEKLNLFEKDYFGLSYRIADNKKNWINMEKRVSKQLKNLPLVLWFEVKFYPPEPSFLADDLTRYYLCLQVRNDIISGKLPCSFMTHAILGSYLIQSQLGDYDPNVHGPPESYLANFSFAPNQTNELLQKICELHQTLAGKTASEVELMYLENAKKLAKYGVDLHEAKDSDDAAILLGVCSSGLLIYRDTLRINRFAWPKILKISYKRNHFYIKIRPGEFEQRETKIGFKLADFVAAERLWKACVEHHTFFRLMAPENPPKKGILRRFGSSRYRYSGRTQYQTRLASGLLDKSELAGRRSMSGPLASRSLDTLHGPDNRDLPLRPFSTYVEDHERSSEIQPEIKPMVLSGTIGDIVEVENPVIPPAPPPVSMHGQIVKESRKRKELYRDQTKRLRDESLTEEASRDEDDVVVLEGTPVKLDNDIGHEEGQRRRFISQQQQNNLPFFKTSTPTKRPPANLSHNNVLHSTTDESEAHEKSTVSANVNNRISSSSPTEFFSSESKSGGNRTIETVKYQTKKDGYIERHVDHCVTIKSSSSIDYDAELSAAILEATKMNPNMTVEKVELRRHASSAASQ